MQNLYFLPSFFKATRLGKHINELRRKASDKQLASRAKSLVKKWRELLMPASGTATPPMVTAAVQATPSSTSTKVEAKAVAQRLNGHHIPSSSQPSSRLTSPAVSSSGGSRLSPGLSNVNNHANNHNNRHHNSSSMPSSASSSPGLSRPTTPNHHNSRPVSPTAVPKTIVANKRLRKDSDSEQQQPAAKKAKGSPTPPSLTNGTCDTSNGLNNHHANKKQRLSKKQMLEQEREHLLEQKLLTARRQASKVRTTQELVQELALRSSTPTSFKSNQSASSSTIANETKTELMNRFFESQQNTTTDVLSPPLSDGPASPNSIPKKSTTEAAVADRETVEDVLAQLPPIDVASILAEINSELQAESDDEEDIEGLIPVHPKAKEQLSDEVKDKLVQELHQGQHESVNGNFNHDGAFKEWHEVVAKETVNGDLLYILPYSVID